jgi:hypothetical protein
MATNQAMATYAKIEGPMAIMQQTLPASFRSGSPAARENRGAFAPDPRPYLVTVPHRKPVKSAQQYLALFPHESEDARLTGATRSLYRRLLALNLPKTESYADAASTAATHIVESILVSSKTSSKIA